MLCCVNDAPFRGGMLVYYVRAAVHVLEIYFSACKIIGKHTHLGNHIHRNTYSQSKANHGSSDDALDQSAPAYVVQEQAP